MVKFTRRHLSDSPADSVAVLGLGRFGSAIALELMRIGADVVGIDDSEEIVQRFNGRLTHVYRTDTTDELSLKELSIDHFDKVVVSIGSNLEASILTCSLLLQFGVGSVWAKATSTAHGRILEQIGVHHVVYPETEMGRRVAHRIRGALLDYIEVGTNFSLVRIEVPPQLAGDQRDELELWRRHRVKIVAVRNKEKGWMPVLPDTMLHEGDVVQILGNTGDVEAFAQQD